MMIPIVSLLLFQVTAPPPIFTPIQPPPIVRTNVPETAPFSRVGAWRVMVDRTLGSGCFLMAEYEGGTVVRLGINGLDGNGYILLGNESWRSLRVGNAYTIEIQLDAEPAWTANAVGFSFGRGDSVFLSATIDRAEFMEEFVSRRGMRVTWQGREIANLRLTDSAAATRELARCQAANPRDPFANAPRADPFAR